MKINESTSIKISLLSLLASVLVVSIHAPCTRQPGFSMLFETYISTYIASVAVPFFFSVSGFLLAMKIRDREGGYSQEIHKRIYSLLFPYIFWCITFTILANLNSFAHNLSLHSSLTRNINFNPISIFGLDLRSNPPLPLWYLRALLIYVLLSPVFHYIAQKRSLSVLFISGLIILDCTKHFFMPAWTKNMLIFDLAPCNVMAFLIGIHLTYYPIALFQKYGYPFIIIGLILFAFLSAVKCEYLHMTIYLKIIFSYLGRLLFIIGAWLLCPPIELPDLLKRQSFPIYLLHALFVPYVLLIAQKLPVLQDWWGFLINIIVLVGLSLITSYLLKRLMPKFSAFIFGGR